MNPYFSDDPNTGGLFSEVVRVIEADNRLSHIPDEVSDIQAVMVPNMVGTGFTSIERMQIQFGETVFILGVDPVRLGLVAIGLCPANGNDYRVFRP